MLLLTQAFTSHTDNDEKTNKIGSPDENPKNNIFKVFFSKKIDKFCFFLITINFSKKKEEIKLI